MDKNMQEEICQAHMAGQMDAGVRDPSWSNALAYFNTLEGVRERAPNTQSMPLMLSSGKCIMCGTVVVSDAPIAGRDY